jgi:hypothetical protein
MASPTSNTPYGIIQDAMYEAGLLGEGDDPSSEQLATNFRKLNDLINLWQTAGIKLFLQKETPIDLVSGQFKYPLTNAVGVVPQKPLRVIEGRIEYPTGERRPIDSIGREEWNRLPQNTIGAVTSYYVDKQAFVLDVYVWNTPDVQEATNTMVLTLQQQVENAINLEQNMAFPQEWRIALKWGLADEICGGQPQAIMDRCQGRAQAFKTQLEDWDVEDAGTRFAPDFRSTYNMGSFS